MVKIIQENSKNDEIGALKIISKRKRYSSSNCIKLYEVVSRFLRIIVYKNNIPSRPLLVKRRFSTQINII